MNVITSCGFGGNSEESPIFWGTPSLRRLSRDSFVGIGSFCLFSPPLHLTFDTQITRNILILYRNETSFCHQNLIVDRFPESLT